MATCLCNVWLHVLTFEGDRVSASRIVVKISFSGQRKTILLFFRNKNPPQRR